MKGTFIIVLAAATLLRISNVQAAVQNAAWLQGATLQDDSVDLNISTATSIKWGTITSVDRTTFDHSLTEPTRLVVKKEGDYLAAVTLPISEPSGARPAQSVEIYVNGQPAEGTLGQSTYIRNDSGHAESSAHVHALLRGLQADDVVVVKTRRLNQLTVVTKMETASFYVERRDPTHAIFSGTATQLQSGTDLNVDELSVDRALVWTAGRKDAGFTHTGPGHEIRLEAAGDYLVFVNVPLTGAVTRASVGLEIKLNGQLVTGGRAQQGYIRNTSGHFASSIHWSGLVRSTAANEALTVETLQRAAAGTVTLPAEKRASIYIEKINSGSGVFFSTAQELVDGPNWNPSVKSAIRWEATGELIDPALFEHGAGSPQQVIVKQAGSYLLVYNDALEGGAARANPRVTVEVNGVEKPGAQTKCHMIRNLDGHAESSGTLVYLLEDLAANDAVTVSAQQEAGGGEVLAQEPALLVLLRKATFVPPTTAPPQLSFFNGDVLGFDIKIEDAGLKVDTNAVQVALDGEAVSATISKTGSETAVSYRFTEFPDFGSDHAVLLTFKDTATPPASHQLELTFKVTTPFAVIPPSTAITENLVDKTQPGFNAFMHQIVFQRPAPRNNLSTVLAQLNGRLIDPATTQPADNVIDNQTHADETGKWDGFIFKESSVINYNQDARDLPDAGAGNLRPDKPIPGIPGTQLSTDEIAMDVTTILQLKKGFHTFGVNSDDGFQVSSAISPKDQLALQLGWFNGARPASDTLFHFVITEDGFYPFRLIWWAAGGAANVEFFSVHNDQKILINDPNHPNAIKSYRVFPKLPYISRMAPAAIELAQRIEVELTNDEITVVPGTVKLILDRMELKPELTQTGAVTTIVYESGDFFPVGEHTVIVQYNESTAPVTTRMREYRFKVPAGQRALLLDQPIGYWRLAETRGTSAASEVNTGLDAELASDTGGRLPGLGAPPLVPNTTDAAVAFDKSQAQLLKIPDHPDVNTAGPYKQKTLELWFKARTLPPFPAGGAFSEKQVLFEEGGATRGFNLYLSGTQPANPTEAELIFHAWNVADTQWGGTNAPVVVKGLVKANTVYHAVLVLNGDDSGNLQGTLSAFLNGNKLGEVKGVHLLFTHTDDTGVGAVSQGSLFHDQGSSGAGHYFDGIIDELALYNTALSLERIEAHFVAGSGPGPMPTEFQVKSIGLEGASIRIEWDGAARLQRAERIEGAFIDVPNAASPYRETIQFDKNAYYRLAK